MDIEERKLLMDDQQYGGGDDCEFEGGFNDSSIDSRQSRQSTERANINKKIYKIKDPRLK